ncbi:MAG: MBOAT family protein [Oscillospiraceae bacterium]|nr:MBOAT family protein [Oscillospiraceae bacterium]
MLFSSIPFLYYFLPLVLALYFLAPKKGKNLVLLIASLFFYFYGEPVYVLLMIGACLSSYIHGLLIHRFRGRIWSKVFLWSSVITSLAMLGFFKYSDFFLENLNAVSGLGLPLLGLALPIGISFYTFQTLSYTVDVYRGDAAVQRNFISLATYVALFPQLIAGPIVRYTTVEEDLTGRTHSVEKFSAGMSRFLMGLGKKVLIANQLGELCDIFRKSTDQSVLFFWLYAIGFSLHIYFDFSGYSDMAIGLGKLFGFRFLENFNYPFISKSISEFWRRWHISLGSWFRDYVYIPLGGNRVSKGKWLRNILIVWLLTGFWHGAAWNFIVWGLFFGFFLVLEKFFLGAWLKKLPGFFAHLYVLFLVLISFVIFNASSMGQAFSDIGGLFGSGGLPMVSREALYQLRSFGWILILALIGATPIPKLIVSKIKANTTGHKILNILEPLFLAGLLLVVTAYLVDGSFNPFLYFRF